MKRDNTTRIKNILQALTNAATGLFLILLILQQGTFGFHRIIFAGIVFLYPAHYLLRHAWHTFQFEMMYSEMRK